MRGHEYIIELRTKHKLKPHCIFIVDNDLTPSEVYDDKHPTMPTVVVNGEFIPALDLRFVKGCVVSATSTKEGRAKALFERLVRFEPKALAVCHFSEKTAWPRSVDDFWMETWMPENNNA